MQNVRDGALAGQGDPVGEVAGIGVGVDGDDAVSAKLGEGAAEGEADRGPTDAALALATATRWEPWMGERRRASIASLARSSGPGPRLNVRPEAR